MREAVRLLQRIDAKLTEIGLADRETAANTKKTARNTAQGGKLVGEAA